MGEFSLAHILVVTVIVLLFFGPSRLPQLGQSVGRAIRGFKEGLNEINGEARDLGAKNEEKPQDKQQLHQQQQAKTEQPQHETSDLKKS
jgi:sec-independent protein translocase protein TatA